MSAAVLALLLAQTCVAEIDLQESPAECSKMWAVNARTANRRGIELGWHTKRYNAYWRRGHTHRRWIGELKADGLQPEHWPKRRNWGRERPRWLAYLEAARRFVAKPDLKVCARADHYGGIPDDGLHADDPKPCPQATRVSCGETLQAYWNTDGCRAARAARRRR